MDHREDASSDLETEQAKPAILRKAQESLCQWSNVPSNYSEIQLIKEVIHIAKANLATETRCAQQPETEQEI